MNDHPTPAELEGFVWNRISLGRARAILSHLVRGCAVCRASLAPHFAGLIGLSEPPAPQLSPQQSAEYDAAIGRAFATVLQKARELREARRREALTLMTDASLEDLPGPAEPLRRVPALADLLVRSWELRHENPLQMSMPGRHRLFRRSFPRTTAVSTVIPIAAIRNRVNGL